MKKLLKYPLIVVAFGVIVIISHRGWMFPVDDILGCYNLTTKTHIDKVCLYSDGRYEQFYIGSDSTPQKYNSNSWQSFTLSEEFGGFVVVSLNEFIIVDSKGEFQAYTNVHTELHKNLFGSVLFTRGINSSGYFREYYRE